MPKGAGAVLLAALALGPCASAGGLGAAEILEGQRWPAPYEAPAFLAAPEVAVPTQEPGIRLSSDARDYAWQAAGEASVARVVTSHLRAANARDKADGFAAEAESVAQSIPNMAPEAFAAEQQAQKDLDKAIEMKKKTQAVIADEEQKAYAAARTAAEAEVLKLEGEGVEYLQTLMQQLKLLGEPKPDLKGEAVAKAQQPYLDLEMRAKQMVAQYLEQSQKMLAQARSLVGTAQATANKARYEQASGFGEMAQRHMMQAHATIGVANEAKAQAKNLHKVAEEINLAVPSYQRAAQMAAAHTFATFPG